MFSRVAPPRPGEKGSPPHAEEVNISPGGSSRPDNVPQAQWEKFQQLKERRKELCSKGRTQRLNTFRKAALATVSSELSEADKQVLTEEGVHLPRCGKKRKRELSAASHSPHESSREHEREWQDKKRKREQSAASQSSHQSSHEREWQEVKKYLDPNPHLSACHEREGTQKSGLEKALDKAIEQGKLEEAAAISDTIATREFVGKVATAFDCVDYVKKQKMEEERKKQKKAKLKWSFEQKSRWETKGNM